MRINLNTQYKSISNELPRAYFSVYTCHKNVAHRLGEKIRVKTHRNFYVSIQLLFYKALTLILC